MLRANPSETREIKELNGLWQCARDPSTLGDDEAWYQHGVPLEHCQPVPVPSSLNDLNQDPAWRDHLGFFWYQLDTFVPAHWQQQRVSLRCGAATHCARVWLNGTLIAEHEGGFLPFEGEATEVLRYGARNRIVIAVDSRLSWRVLPPGQVTDRGDRQELPEDWQGQEFHFDFFNYVGLHRPVAWHVAPKAGLTALALTPDFDDASGAGLLQWQAAHAGNRATLSLEDPTGAEVLTTDLSETSLRLEGALAWAPGSPNLYTVVVRIFGDNGEVIDVYRQRTGFRSVRCEDGKFLLNGQPFYLTGFGRHEDAPLRGRGLDMVHQIKDANLAGWMGRIRSAPHTIRMPKNAWI